MRASKRHRVRAFDVNLAEADRTVFRDKRIDSGGAYGDRLAIVFAVPRADV
jgi:hypothetical protein